MQRNVHFGTGEIQQTYPIQIAGLFENLQGIAKSLQSLGETPHLHKSHTVKGGHLGLLQRHPQVFEFLHCSVCQYWCVFGKAEIHVYLGFVKVAESTVTLASRSPKLLPKVSERVQGVTVSATQILKVCAIVSCLDRKLGKLKLITEIAALL